MNKKFHILLKLFTFSIFLSIIFGSFRTELMITTLKGLPITVVRLSAYTSLTVSILMAYLVIFLIFTISWYILKYIESEISFNEFCASYIFIIITLLIGELFKFFTTILMLKGELKEIVFNEEIIEQLKNTIWYDICQILDYLFLGLAILLFSISVIRKVNISDTIIISIVILLLFLLSRLNFEIGLY